jgi:uncharacterized protein YraI
MVLVNQFVENIEIIYSKKPKYVWACADFDKCDCIGMIKKALEMAGASTNGLSGTNAAARYTIKNFQKIKSVKQLKVGDVVLKGRPYDPKDNYPLPDKYLKGGTAYNGDTTNYVHIGVVTKVNPLEITHMTSPTAKKDTSLGKWNYFGQLPQVDYKDNQVVIIMEYATVTGGTLNMRKDSDVESARIAQVPNGTKVAILEKGAVWCKAVYKDNTGYVMTKYLKFESGGENNFSISLSPDCARELYEALKLSLKL